MRIYKVRNIIFPSSGGTKYGLSYKKNSEEDQANQICSYGIIKLTIEK